MSRLPARATPAKRPEDAGLRWRWLAALGAGLALPLAFAPYGVWPLAALSPAMLLALVRERAPRHAAVIGWSWGIGSFGHGVWWIQVSVHQFGVPYYLFSVTVTALFVAGMALYPALFAWLWARLPARNPGVRLLLLAPALWLLVEWLRGTLFTGFPWLALGYSQVDSPLAGFAPVLGVPACSLALMLCAAALVQGWSATWRQRWLLAGAVAALFAAGAGLKSREWTVPAGAALDAVLVQGAVPQPLKWQRAQRTASLALYQRLSAPHWDADVLLWPETAIPAFPSEIPEVIEALHAQATASGTDLLVGMPTGEPWNDRYFNSVVDFGATPGRYDKRHLVPFGEFFPFKDELSNIALLLSIPMSDFSAGAPRQDALEVAGYKAGVSICFEDAFAYEVARALPQANFLVNVSNDAWFGDTIAPHQHLEIARMRALESGRPLLRATNTGISAVIDERGRVTARAPQFAATSLGARFVPRQGMTPYTRLGDGPLLVAALVLIILIAADSLRARRG